MKAASYTPVSAVACAFWARSDLQISFEALLGVIPQQLAAINIEPPGRRVRQELFY